MKKISTVILFLVLSFVAYTQENKEPIIDEYDVFYDYTHWGFSVMPILYESPKFTPNSVAKIQADSYVPSVQLAFRFHFNHAKAFSFNTGLIFTWIPLVQYSFTLKEEDVFVNDDRFFNSDGFSDSYVLIPLNLEYKLRAGKNLYLNLNSGVSFSVRGGFTAHDEHGIRIGQESLFKPFNFNYRSSNFYFNAQVSTGLYIIFDKFMLRTNVLYNKSFQDIQKGEYEFSGLRVSSSETGSFSFSGDYFGISTTVYFKRKN